MLNLDQYSSLGAALRDALDRWGDETCLIESDRDRERTRLTYSDFKELALPLARALEDAELHAGERAAIIMSNQSKWLISAYAIFYCGAVLVPLDYKLTAAEQLQLLAHCKAKIAIVEFYLWRAMMESPEVKNLKALVLVTEAPLSADLGSAFRWEDFRRKGDPVFVPRKREDVACIVYSSGTGGRPKGCVLTHENYLEQCKALTAWYPFWPGVRYLSILPTNHAIDFMVGFIGPFVCGACVVHLRTLRPEFVRDAFVRYKITHVSLVPMVLKNLERGVRAKFEALPALKRFVLDYFIALNKSFTRARPNLKLSRRLLPQVHKAFGGELVAIFTGGAFMEPSTLEFFYELGIPVANGYGLTEAGTVLTVNDRELTTFNGCNDDGGKLRPVKILCNLVNVQRASPADLALVSRVNNQLFDFNPFEKRCRPRREFRLRGCEFPCVESPVHRFLPSEVEFIRIPQKESF